jgi:hypothetical protein
MECNSSTKLGQDIISLKVDKHRVAHGYKTVSMICYGIELFSVSFNGVRDSRAGEIRHCL